MRWLERLLIGALVLVLVPVAALFAFQALGFGFMLLWGASTLPWPVLVAIPLAVWGITVARKRLTGERF